MVIEYLKFRVPSELQEAFIETDKAVWTTGLQRFPGFLGKEVWLDVARNEILIIVRWATKEQWKSIPQEAIDALDRQMGELRMPILESGEYQVCSS